MYTVWMIITPSASKSREKKCKRNFLERDMIFVAINWAGRRFQLSGWSKIKATFVNISPSLLSEKGAKKILVDSYQLSAFLAGNLILVIRTETGTGPVKLEFPKWTIYKSSTI